MAAATLCDGDKDGVDLQLERRLSPQLPQRAREEGGGGEASSGPFLVVVVLRGRRPPDLFLSPPPSCARWRKPRRRPPPLPPRPVDARAFRPPVDARTHPRLPIDDGGDGGAALPVAKKSPSSSSSRALDRDAAEARGVPPADELAAGGARAVSGHPSGTRLLIGGRDAVQQALDRLAEASHRMVEAEEAQAPMRLTVAAGRRRGGGARGVRRLRRRRDVKRSVPVWELNEHEERRV
ncbi:hypothetical protein OsJ_07179 [Oryza sativa Japonica Group]|uniref:Uncharacterized protein n=1 Tax=Oryza sativa subsp. japonica TaxID=39947 RepID=B9F0M2_ORYSJ|nr:hypothetical protein OsJ_07179 [Oryza sativa Japonica Group]